MHSTQRAHGKFLATPRYELENCLFGRGLRTCFGISGGGVGEAARGAVDSANIPCAGAAVAAAAAPGLGTGPGVRSAASSRLIMPVCAVKGAMCGPHP